MASSKKANIGGIVFVGCLFLGIGVGMLVDQVGAGTIIGLGIGFIAMAVINKKT